MNRPYFHVDAFTETAPGGNACAVVLDAQGIPDDTMQAVARDMNLSETAFVVPSARADFGARYFTPVEEIPMAGHPTIATVHALLVAGRIEAPTSVTLELPVGPIPVDVSADGVITMSQMAPEYGKEYAPEVVLPLFGLEPGDLLAPIQTVSTGTPQLMVPLRGLEALRRVKLDVDAYTNLRAEGDFFSAHLFCLEGATHAGDTFARHFVTPPDFVEDPFTGSATGGMAAYLWRRRLLDGPRFTAEQGHWMLRPGRARVEVVGPPDAIETVRVGGAAAVLAHGELTLRGE